MKELEPWRLEGISKALEVTDGANHSGLDLEIAFRLEFPELLLNDPAAILREFCGLVSDELARRWKETDLVVKAEDYLDWKENYRIYKTGKLNDEQKQKDKQSNYRRSKRRIISSCSFRPGRKPRDLPTRK